MKIFSIGKQHFYSFMEFFVMRLKNQGVKIWIFWLTVYLPQIIFLIHASWPWKMAHLAISDKIFLSSCYLPVIC